MLLFRLSGVLLLRFAERALSGWLFHEPPRNTRRPSLARSPGKYDPRKERRAQALDVGVAGMADPTLHRGVEVFPFQPATGVSFREPPESGQDR